MKRWTEQELFTTVATHLLQQLQVSINCMGECQYRGPNNMRCAIGCLIADDDYVPDMEGKIIKDLFAIYPDNPSVSAMSDVEPALVYELQRLHDERETYRWRSELERIAERRNLIMPIAP